MHLPTWGPFGLLAKAPEEVWFFLRIAAYAIFIGTVYWLVSYEAAGTMLLYGFGIAAGFGFLILLFGSRGRRAARDAQTEAEREVEPDGPFGDESGRIPSPTLAPLAVGLGAALLGVGLILGPWLIGLGLIVFAYGGIDWLFAAGREYRAVDATPTSEEVAASQHGGGSAAPATTAPAAAAQRSEAHADPGPR